MNNILTQIGLGSDDANVYKTLVRMGGGNVAAVARQSTLHRPAVYRALDRLADRGLVHQQVHGKRTIYLPAKPEQLHTLWQDVGSQLDRLVDELNMSAGSRLTKPEVTYIEGIRGIRAIFDDIVMSLKPHDTFYRYSSRVTMHMSKTFHSSTYRKLRDEKQLERFVISNEKVKASKKPRLERSLKIVPKEFDLFDYDVTQIIYGSKVVFIDYNTLSAVRIDNAMIAMFQQRIFQLLYRLLP